MSYDAIIIGAGHNGLTTAAYLARAGLRVKVLEKRNIVGGACVTEEFHPGFKNSTCAYVVSMLSPKIIKDLKLEKQGLEIIERPSGMLTLLSPDKYLLIPRDAAAAKREIEKFSERDASAHSDFEDELTRFAEVLRELAHRKPFNFGSGFGNFGTGLKLANTFRKLSVRQKERLLCLFTQSIGDYLDSWFESPEIKGHYAFDGMVGNFASPWSAGSAYILLHHEFGEINGKAGAWGHARGGMGAITQALARSAISHGADIETGASVAQVLNENGKAVGVRLENGREIRARMVAANCTPKILFLNLLKEQDVPGPFHRRMKSWRSKSAVLRMNIALSELPKFTALADITDPMILARSVNICPSMDYLETAYRDATVRGWSKNPVISMNFPSLLDDSLAPQGQHVMSLFCQHFSYDLPDKLNWADVKDEAVETVIETVAQYAPNFRQAILGVQALSPHDLETEYGLSGGDIFHGALHLDQLYALRPAAGHADYRMPVKNLYLCGAGAHPGGGVSGLPGLLAAKEIIRDFKKQKKTA